MTFFSAVIVGNLGNDAEMRYTPNGQAVSSFDVATTRRWKDAQGQTHEETTWSRVQIWGKSAEVLTPYLTKGKKVLCQCDRYTVEAWLSKKTGEPAARAVFTAQQVQFMNRKGDDEPQQGQSQHAADTGAADGPDIPW